MSARREGKIEVYLIDRVESRGGLIRKAKWLCRRGCPDRFVAFPSGGRNGLVEVKPEGEPLAPHQAREIERLRAAGVNVAVVDSFEAVDRLVEEWWRG